MAVSAFKSKKNCIKSNSPNSGFTFLEVIVAIYVIIVGFTGAMSLLTFVVGSASVSYNRLIAAHLAQEGLEVVRNIRDSNWGNWFSAYVPGDYRVQYNTTDIDLLPIYNNPPLRFRDDAPFYQYDQGSDSIFRRKIILNRISSVEAQVIAQVTWTDKGRSYSMEVDSRLWDWR